MFDEYTFYPPDPDKTLEWITVLAAAGLDYRLSRDAAGWQLHVPAAKVERAREELEAYEAERSALPASPTPPPAPPISPRAAWTAFWFAHLFVLFYIWWGPFDASQSAHMAGSAQAGRIVAGEWWRTLTALTLHSGLPHLAGNVLFIALIGQAVLDTFGLGPGLLLMLAGGMLGNTVAAFTASPMQIGVGSSTMAFAALGSICAHRTIGAWRASHHNHPATWSRVWIPLAAGIAMLGFTGSAPHTDLAAHAFGFAAGASLAFLLGLLGPRRLPRVLDRLLIASAFATPVFGWLIALRSGN